MNNLNNVLSIQEYDEEQVVVKVNANDSLTVAKYPFLSGDMAYITVTRGDDHIFTVIKKDGKTWSFEFGSKGHTLIGESTERLKKEVLQFIKENDIILGRIKGEPREATVYYNSNFKKWQLTIETTKGRFYFHSDTAKDYDSAIKDFERFIKADWNKGIAVTGIDVWKAQNPVFTLK